MSQLWTNYKQKVKKKWNSPNFLRFLIPIHKGDAINSPLNRHFTYQVLRDYSALTQPTTSCRFLNINVEFRVLESKRRPISRVLSRNDHSSWVPLMDTTSDLPRSDTDHVVRSLFGLAPSGVYLANPVASDRGALLPHHFTLTVHTAVCFLLHLP